MTNLPTKSKHPLAEYAAAIGIDWADQKHDITLQPDPAGHHEQAVEHRVIESTPQALMNWIISLQQRFEGKIAIAIEQKRGPLISFLSGLDFIDIYPVPTVMLKKLRDALYPSGSKTDPIDSGLALDVLVKHTDRLRPMKPESAEVRELAALCEDRRHLVDERTGKLQALREACKGYFPVMVELFDFKTPIVCRFLQRWDTLEKLQKAKPATLRKFFYANRCRGDVIERRLAAIKAAVALTKDPGVIHPMKMRVAVLCKQIITLFEAVDPYEQRIDALFEALPSAAIFKSLPGAGKAMAPRLAVAFGEDRSKFQGPEEIQNLSGTSPVTKRSGNSQIEVHFRWAAPGFMRQSFVEWANHSRKSSLWAQAFYKQRLERGDRHNTALRKLAWKWQRILFRLWSSGEIYDEEKYLDALKKNGSPLVAEIAALQDVA
jgi:transposase